MTLLSFGFLIWGTFGLATASLRQRQRLLEGHDRLNRVDQMLDWQSEVDRSEEGDARNDRSMRQASEPFVRT